MVVKLKLSLLLILLIHFQDKAVGLFIFLIQNDWCFWYWIDRWRQDFSQTVFWHGAKLCTNLKPWFIVPVFSKIFKLSIELYLLLMHLDINKSEPCYLDDLAKSFLFGIFINNIPYNLGEYATTTYTSKATVMWFICPMNRQLLSLDDLQWYHAIENAWIRLYQALLEIPHKQRQC